MWWLIESAPMWLAAVGLGLGIWLVARLWFAKHIGHGETLLLIGAGWCYVALALGGARWWALWPLGLVVAGILTRWVRSRPRRDRGADEFRAEERARAERVTARDPRNAEGHRKLGELLEEEGKLTEAVACYEEALRHEPGMILAQHRRDLLLRRLAVRDSGQTSCPGCATVQPPENGRCWKCGRTFDERALLMRKVREMPVRERWVLWGGAAALAATLAGSASAVGGSVHGAGAMTGAAAALTAGCAWWVWRAMRGGGQ